MATLAADVSLGGLHFNGRLFNSPVPPAEYASVLGSTVRIIDPCPPAPYGHRNNQIHVFDEHGLYLIEHHATRLIDSVVFVLWLEESQFKTSREFSGHLIIGGVELRPGMLVKEFSGSSITFNGPELGLWIAENDGVWIVLAAQGIRNKSGRRGKVLRLSSVNICFRNRAT